MTRSSSASLEWFSASARRPGRILASRRQGSVTKGPGGNAGLARPIEAADDVGREALELLEIVVARRQDHVLDAGPFEVADALDDLARGPEAVRLLEIVERAMRAHHALE